MNRVLIAVAISALAALSTGCGLKGKLERPAPLWGSARESYQEQQKREAAAAKAERDEKRTRVAVPVTPDNPTPDTIDVSKSQGATPPIEDIRASSPRY